MPSFIDYSNKQIGRVFVIELAKKTPGGTTWNCKCACGKIFTCWSSRFKIGERFECNNCRNERKRGIDLTGRKFGRWTVLKQELDKNNKTVWKVRCDCGAIGLVATYALGKKGKSMSCGCLGRKEKSRYVNETLYPPQHLTSLTKLYHIRTRIVHSCYNPKHATYGKFGACGFSVCDLWRNGAKDFVDWAISNGWNKTNIVNIYEGKKEFNPQNCYIISKGDFHKKTLGKRIEFNGENKTCEEWADIIGLSKHTLLDRLTKGYSIEDALFLKPHAKSGTKKWDDETIKKLYLSGLSSADVGRQLNLSYNAVSKRLKLMGINTTQWSGRRKYKNIICSQCLKEFTPTSSKQRKCFTCPKK